MNLEFQAITEKDKDKNKYKISSITLQNNKTKYSEGAVGFCSFKSCNYTIITQMSRAKKSKFKGLEVPYSKQNGVQSF